MQGVDIIYHVLIFWREIEHKWMSCDEDNWITVLFFPCYFFIMSNSTQCSTVACSKWPRRTWRSASRSTSGTTRACSAGRSETSFWRTGCATEAQLLQVRHPPVSTLSFILPVLNRAGDDQKTQRHIGGVCLHVFYNNTCGYYQSIWPTGDWLYIGLYIYKIR